MTAVAFVELEGLSRDEWLEARRQGIGGSDAPAIAGLDRFRSPLTVYYDKLGELDDDDAGEAARWGNRLEQAAADEFEERNPGLTLAKPTAMYQSVEHPFMLANPDREAFTLPELAPWGAVEIKTTRLDEDWTDGPPVRVIVQGQHYAAVKGYERIAICVFLLGGYGIRYEQWIIERDDELVGMLVELEGEFWQRVLDRRPPAPDGHRSTSDTLGRIYRRAVEGSSVDLGPDAVELVSELRLAKRNLADAKADVASLENGIKALLGEHEIGLVDGEPVVTWKAPKSSGRKHNCPDCAHAPDGPPSRRFDLKGER